MRTVAIIAVAIVALLAITVRANDEDTMLFAPGGQHNLPREECECVCRHNTAKNQVREALDLHSHEVFTEKA